MKGCAFNDMRKHEKPSNRREGRPNQQWNTIDWKQAESYVNRLQIRIVKAVQKGNWNLVKRLQYLLVHSFYAKALSVKRVTTNKGKKTAGIDQVLWEKAKEKMKAVHQLQQKGYTAKPLKRVYIEKFGKKEKRPLSIPTMKDRAMQALYLLALEPIAETTADRISFGFRKNRSAHDAMEYLFRLLARKSSPSWILEGDIKSCFDRISHAYLLTRIPMDKKILKKFLTAGYMYQHELFPTSQGSAQGGTISPTLANMVLDGMEEAIGKAFWRNKSGRIDKKNHNPWHINLVRYADDFAVTADNPQIAEEVKEVIKTFLGTRGLQLSEEKTKITHIEDGFVFLGWNFRKYRGKLIITPSRKSFNKVKRTLSSIIKSSKTATQEKIILELNQCIRGWTNYHQPVCAKRTFAKLYTILWNMLWKWAKRRHPNKGSFWIKNKYWRTVKSRKWIFMTNRIVLINPNDTPIIRHTQLQLRRNPFLDHNYFEVRKNDQRRKNKTAYYRTTAAQIFSGLKNA